MTSQPNAFEDRDELFRLIRERSFRRGQFTLSSGAKSEMYFNLKPTMMHPRGAHLAAAALLQMVRREGADWVGGLEMGAVPVIASLAALSEMQGHPVRTFFVRKKPKEHGTKERIEGLAPGESLAGARVMIVDDVATTGTSVLEAAKAAREAGAIVESALVLVDREEGAAENLAPAGIRLLSVFRGQEFLRN